MQQTRPISSDELAVIRAAAVVGRRGPIPEGFLEDLAVIGTCDCGCASVDFVSLEEATGKRILADAVGTTPEGGMVGVLVWGTDVSITGLEVYDLGAGTDATGGYLGELVKLPVPTSIRAWPESNQARTETRTDLES